MRILILGGYGVFGGRLAELLADLPQLTLIIAGRSEAKARDFCSSFEGVAVAEPLALDRRDVGGVLEGGEIDLVVDASGPFQDYGDDPYVVVKAAITAQVPYLDLADSADFVFGVSQFDEAAEAAGIFVLSGVSSFPVLTAAVVRALSDGSPVRRITGGIAPSPYAGVGLNVMRAVISYAGAPVQLWKDGQAATLPGLASSMRYTIAPPGRLPLRNIHFSLVDVPDLRVLPPEHPQLESIWMGAGPVPEVLHRMLNLLAKARARLRLPSLAPLAPLFYRVLNLMKFGEHRGGMFVEVETDRGTRSWHMLAEGDDGPYIPSMAVEALVRKMILGDRPEPGARPATHALELSDYDALFEGRAITHGMRDDAGGTLYQRILGAAYADLPAPVQELHDLTEQQVWQGEAEVRAGRNPLARAVAWLFGFPRAGTVPLTVTLTPEARGERWQRDFGGKRFESFQSEGQGRNAHLMLERFGPVTVALALVVRDGRLYLEPRRWFIFGVPMPRVLLPSPDSFEHVQNGDFAFDVVIKAPIVGLIAGYRGRLTRQR